MSPDLHWHVGEDAEQEIIVQAAAPRRSRRSWIAVLIVIVLGTSLGVAYRSLPEPAPRPTLAPSPTPQPTPTHPPIPTKLFQTIDREAQALADGNVQAYLDLHVYSSDVERLQNNFQAWGWPTNGQPLYSIVDFNLRTPTSAWADVRQIRNGRSFRETRFYIWDNDRWLRTDPDPFFWTGATETHDTPHLHMIYAAEDRELARALADQIEELVTSLCVDLKCTAATLPFTYTVNMNNYQQVGDNLSADGQTLSLLSPRVMGIYEDRQPYRQNDDLNGLISQSIVQRVAYGRAVNAATIPDGAVITLAIGSWAGDRVNPKSSRVEQQLNWAKSNIQLTQTLESLWKLGIDSDWPPAHAEAFTVVYFIEHEYGASFVVQLLHALGSAKSMPDVIEKSLGIPFSEFDQKWQKWTKVNIAKQ